MWSNSSSTQKTDYSVVQLIILHYEVQRRYENALKMRIGEEPSPLNLIRKARRDLEWNLLQPTSVV